MSSKYFKSERVLLDGRFKPATLAVEEGTIRQILDYSFPNSDDGHVVDFGEKTRSSWASGYTCSYKRTWQN